MPGPGLLITSERACSKYNRFLEDIYTEEQGHNKKIILISPKQESRWVLTWPFKWNVAVVLYWGTSESAMFSFMTEPQLFWGASSSLCVHGWEKSDRCCSEFFSCSRNSQAAYSLMKTWLWKDEIFGALSGLQLKYSKKRKIYEIIHYRTNL